MEEKNLNQYIKGFMNHQRKFEEGFVKILNETLKSPELKLEDNESIKKIEEVFFNTIDKRSEEQIKFLDEIFKDINFEQPIKEDLEKMKIVNELQQGFKKSNKIIKNLLVEVFSNFTENNDRNISTKEELLNLNHQNHQNSHASNGEKPKAKSNGNGNGTPTSLL